MTTYIALLKGINVGGKNIIKMADLKQHFSTMGLSNVRTYIQSGNVLFESEKEEKILQEELEQQICKKFGFQVPIILRTTQEMQRIISGCPYTKEDIETAGAGKEVEVFYIALFNEPPSNEDIKRFSDAKTEHESFKIIGRDMYMLFSDSVRFSKLAATLQKVKTINTVRNWKTINKLMSLV
jgi:uncharacterized protein (DUF1697 family)